MTITVFNDVILPNSVVAAGIRGKQIRNNTRTEAANGEVMVNINWSRTLRQYEIGFIPMPLDTWRTIEGLHEVTEGGAYGFLLQDPKDHTAGAAGMALAASTDTTFQLCKNYLATGSIRSKTRTITRPCASGFALSVNGATLGSGSYSLNTDTGVITIASKPAANTIGWTGNFYVPVHFMDDAIDWDLVKAGTDEGRLMAGPNVILMEVRE